MSEVAVRVERLSKRYQLTLKQTRHDTLYDHITASVGGLFTRRRREPPVDDTLWALKDISFQIAKGERTGIIGRNGAGKSTLLKILSRITPPTEGQAEVFGRVGSLLEVGTGFHGELSGRENIFLNGMMLGMSRQYVEQRFDEIVEFSEIEKFIDTPVKRYSSGMYVRLAFAVAAHLEPEILIVDEVLAVGDQAFRQKCLGKMDEVGSEGRTVLFVSHDLANIRRLCNRAIWLEGGEVRAIGDARELSFQYEAASTTTKELGEGVFERTSPIDSEIWLDRLEILDEGGVPETKFDFGEPMRLRLSIASRGGTTLNNFHVLWVISDEHDNRISTSSTEHYDLAVTKRSGAVECRIERLPLYKGRYKLEVGLFHESVGRFDTWPNAGGFDVVHSAPTGSGFELDGRSGSVYLDQAWTVD